MPFTGSFPASAFSRRHALRALGLLLGGSWLGAGCAQQAPDAGSSPGATTTASRGGASTSPGTGPSGLRVGLITVGKVSDKGWNQSASDGLQKIKADLSAEVLPPVEEPALGQVESVMRDQATQGCSIVFGNASEYDSAAKAVSSEIPTTTFVVVGGKTSGPNLIPIQLQANQACYLAGMVAGGMTKTGKIGLVGGTEIPIIKEAFAAFVRGAKAANPKAQVKTTFTGSFTDAARAKQQTQALLDGGSDVIMHNANDAGAGVFQAVSEKQGVMVIGANAPQHDQATDKNIGSFVLDVPNAMTSVARAIRDGKADGSPYRAGLKDKAVGFQFNPGFKGTVPADLKAKVQKAQDAIVAGALDPNQ